MQVITFQGNAAKNGLNQAKSALAGFAKKPAVAQKPALQAKAGDAFVKNAPKK